MKTFIYSILLLFVLSPALQAQNEDQGVRYVDVVYTVNGSVFRGKILEYAKGDSLRMEILGGLKITMEEAEISKIVQERVDVSENQKKTFVQRPYNFREKGIYNATHLAFMGGKAAWNGKFTPAISIQNVTGFQFNRFIGAGIGFGYDVYDISNGFSVLPVFAEARGYLNQRNISPYYSLSVGYGFAVSNGDNLIRPEKGGVMIHPALGFRFGANKDLNFLADIGFIYQKATYYQNWEWEQDYFSMAFKRWSFRIGMLF